VVGFNRFLKQDIYRIMSVSRLVAKSKVDGMVKQIQECPFHDVIVVVDNIEFPCHRFMLSACSDVFRAMFQSGMKEDLTRSVDLKGIDPDTFRLILDFIYLSKYILSIDNISRVWRAAHQLQMSSLLAIIFKFQMKRLSYVNRPSAEIYFDSKLLNSKQLMRKAMSNMAIRFNKLRLSEDILRLDVEEMKTLLSHKFFFPRSEDDVIEAILFWISNKPLALHLDEYKSPKSRDDPSQANSTNQLDTAVTVAGDRSEFLFELLAKSKILLISPACSQNLLENNLVRRDPRALALVRESVRYHLQPGRRHDYCPLYGMIRQANEFTNVIFIISERLYICRRIDGKWCNMQPEYKKTPEPVFKYCQTFKARDREEPDKIEAEPEIVEEKETLTFKKPEKHETMEKEKVDEEESEEDEIEEQYLELDNTDEMEIETQLDCKAVTYENDIFWTGRTYGVFLARKYKAATNTWNQIAIPNIARHEPALVCFEHHLYLIGGANCELIERFDVDTEQKAPGFGRWKNYGKLVVPMSNLTATTCGHLIVIFGSQADESSETVVQVFNPRILWTYIFRKNMPVSANNLVCFKHGEDTFVLEGSGALWKVTVNSQLVLDIGFHLKLWDDQTLNLAGATVTNQELLLFIDDQQVPKPRNVANFEHFQTLRFIESRGGFCFLNTIVHRLLVDF
ncbi:kelch protein 3, partial [Biomphalaria glabrata]